MYLCFFLSLIYLDGKETSRIAPLSNSVINHLNYVSHPLFKRGLFCIENKYCMKQVSLRALNSSFIVQYGFPGLARNQ